MDQSHHDDRSRLLDETLAFISRKNVKEEKEDDADYDFKEFDDAEVEEAEDRIYSEYKRCQGEGQVMEEQVLKELAGPVPLEDMDQSIVMSAR